LSYGNLSGTSGAAPRPRVLPPAAPVWPRPPCCATVVLKENVTSTENSKHRIRRLCLLHLIGLFVFRHAWLLTAPPRRCHGRIPTRPAGIHEQLSCLAANGPDTPIESANPGRTERQFHNGSGLQCFQ